MEVIEALLFFKPLKNNKTIIKYSKKNYPHLALPTQ